jgi:hypothetical protein
MICSLASLLVGATIAIQADDARDMSNAQIAELLSALASAVERRTGESSEVEPFRGSPCDRRDRCAGEVFAQSGATRVILMRAYAVPSKIRVLIELRDRDGRMLRSSHADILHDRTQWRDSFDALALALFPSSKPALEVRPDPNRAVDHGTRASLEPVALQQAESRPRWAWLLVGASSLPLGAAVALGVDNLRAREEGARPGVPPSRVSELQTRALASGIGANVLYTVAAAMAITGAVFLIIE